MANWANQWAMPAPPILMSTYRLTSNLELSVERRTVAALSAVLVRWQLIVDTVKNRRHQVWFVPNCFCPILAAVSTEHERLCRQQLGLPNLPTTCIYCCCWLIHCRWLVDSTCFARSWCGAQRSRWWTNDGFPSMRCTSAYRLRGLQLDRSSRL